MQPGQMHKVIPVGQSGSVKIVHDSPDQLTRMQAAFHHQPLYADTYTRLLIDNTLWMTDAEYECQTLWPFISSAKRDVLVVGLGLGLCVKAVEKSKAITTLTILEKNADVIKLVAPTLPKHVKIIQGDAFKWNAPKRAFDLIYFDIWPNVPNEDDRDDLRALRLRYRRALKRGGRTLAWCEDKIQRR